MPEPPTGTVFCTSPPPHFTLKCSNKGPQETAHSGLDNTVVDTLNVAAIDPSLWWVRPRDCKNDSHRATKAFSVWRRKLKHNLVDVRGPSLSDTFSNFAQASSSLNSVSSGTGKSSPRASICRPQPLGWCLHTHSAVPSHTRFRSHKNHTYSRISW